MSAFMHADATFDAIAATIAYATVDSFRRMLDGEYEHDARYSPTKGETGAVLFARDLFAANAISVNYRYRDSHLDPAAYRPSVARGSLLTLVQLYKLLRSVDYQSCEPADWLETRTGQLLSRVLHWMAADIIANLPEYRAAKWEL